MSWYFTDESDEIALTHLQHVRDHGADVLSIWPLEILNIMLQVEKRGRGNRENASQFLRVLDKLDIRVAATQTGDDGARLMEIARQYKPTVYDAAYIDLALRLSCPLATLDKQLARAARDAGLAAIPATP